MEEFIDPGVNGALWKGQPDGLAQAIITLLQKPDELKQLGTTGQTKTHTKLPSTALPGSIRTTFAKADKPLLATI